MLIGLQKIRLPTPPADMMGDFLGSPAFARSGRPRGVQSSAPCSSSRVGCRKPKGSPVSPKSGVEEGAFGLRWFHCFPLSHTRLPSCSAFRVLALEPATGVSSLLSTHANGSQLQQVTMFLLVSDRVVPLITSPQNGSTGIASCRRREALNSAAQPVHVSELDMGMSFLRNRPANPPPQGNKGFPLGVPFNPPQQRYS